MSSFTALLLAFLSPSQPVVAAEAPDLAFWRERIEQQVGRPPSHIFQNDEIGTAIWSLELGSESASCVLEDPAGRPLVALFGEKLRLPDAEVSLFDGRLVSEPSQPRLVGWLDDRHTIRIHVRDGSAPWHVISLSYFAPDGPENLFCTFTEVPLSKPVETTPPQPLLASSGSGPASVSCTYEPWGDISPPTPGEVDEQAASTIWATGVIAIQQCTIFPNPLPVLHSQCHFLAILDWRSGSDEFESLSNCALSPDTSDVFFLSGGADGGNCSGDWHWPTAFIPFSEGGYFRECGDVFYRCRGAVLLDEWAANGKVKRFYLKGTIDEVRPAQPTPFRVDFPAVFMSSSKEYAGRIE